LARWENGSVKGGREKFLFCLLLRLLFFPFTFSMCPPGRGRTTSVSAQPQQRRPGFPPTRSPAHTQIPIIVHPSFALSLSLTIFFHSGPLTKTTMPAVRRGRGGRWPLTRRPSCWQSRRSWRPLKRRPLCWRSRRPRSSPAKKSPHQSQTTPTRGCGENEKSSRRRNETHIFLKEHTHKQGTAAGRTRLPLCREREQRRARGSA
jgi:hypothetical protein